MRRWLKTKRPGSHPQRFDLHASGVWASVLINKHSQGLRNNNKNTTLANETVIHAGQGQKTPAASAKGGPSRAGSREAGRGPVSWGKGPRQRYNKYVGDIIMQKILAATGSCTGGVKGQDTQVGWDQSKKVHE